MEAELIVLSVAVFAAATLQAATGIGFGVIAGPLMLVVLNDAAAIQISVALNLLIALLLTPSLYRHASRPVLSSLLVGVVVGTPLGVVVFLILDIVLLKVLAGIAVAFTLLMLVRRARAGGTPKDSPPAPERIAIGIVAGTMGGSLAMPGPVPAAWMSARGFDKQAVRATVLLMFVAAYGVALILQFYLAGIVAETLRLCAFLMPATVVGVGAGHLLSRRISEQVFRGLLVTVLLLTVILLIVTVVQDYGAVTP